MVSIAARSKAERGFTLLEAIVALAVIALALIPLISYIAQAADAFRRAGESNERSMVMQAALALMDPVNPTIEPDGQLAIDDAVSMTWHSDIAVPPNTGVLVGGGLSNFRMGFYNVHVTLSRADDPTWVSFDLRKAGYQRINTGFPMGGNAPPVAGAGMP